MYQLASIKRFLRSTGERYIEEGDIVSAKLLLYCSVDFSVEDGKLRYVPKLGLVRREYSVLLTILLIIAMGTFYIYFPGIGPFGEVILFLLFGGLIWDVYRYIATEGLIMRVVQGAKEL